ncbi:8077_t:CDS:2 [Funneliformis geosporum]|nr:8077_t:CDS:2 [Funneliformis geosporum]
MEYADGGTLCDYLKKNFKKLTWNDKYNFAYQLAGAVSCLHEEGIVHRDLHSNSVLIHQNSIKLADFGVSKERNSIKESSKHQTNLCGAFPYIDPKLFSKQIKNVSTQIYTLNEKSDVYSVGMLLWELSSGRSPFCDMGDFNLHWKIFQGFREEPAPDTPTNYVNLYKDCWSGEPENRPTMNQVVTRMKEIIAKSYKTINNYQTDDFIIDIQYKPEDELKMIVDRMVTIIFKMTNDGKEPQIRRQHVIDYISIYNVSLKEIYTWLLNNQNNSTMTFLLGYFNYFGIETSEYKEKAFELFTEASKQNHILAQYYIGICCQNGYGTIKDQDLAFKYFEKVANKDFAAGQLNIGYFYEYGIGVEEDSKLAIFWYEKAANNGNMIAKYNLGLCYKNGIGVEKDYKKAFKLFEQSAKGDYLNGISILGYFYRNGIGTCTDEHKAFNLYQKASSLGDNIAQYNLAIMFEDGIGIRKDIDQAIYWYKKSAESGFQKAQNRFEELSKINKRKDDDNYTFIRFAILYSIHK